MKANRMDRVTAVKLYEQYGGRLCGMLQERFDVPQQEAELLVLEIFSAMMMSESSIDDIEKWLIGASCSAGRKYAAEKTEAGPEEPDTAARSERTG